MFNELFLISINFSTSVLSGFSREPVWTYRGIDTDIDTDRYISMKYVDMCECVWREKKERDLL